MSKSYIVTGGAGFIGSHMCEFLLSRKFKVVCFDNLKQGSSNNIKLLKKYKNFKFYKIDLLDKKKLNKIKLKNIYGIFHFAGIGDIVPAIERPTEYVENNALGTLNILEYARHNKILKFTYAASSSCYGLPKKIPISENSNIDIQHPYALSKYLGEQLVLHWNKVYKMKTDSVRIFNAYGLRSRTSGAYGAVLGVFLKQKIKNKPLTIVGDGNQTRDFINVKDLVLAFYKVQNSKKSGQIYNVGSGKEKSVNTLANLISNKIMHIPKRPAEPNRSLANIKKIKKLGWKPRINFKDGINEILNNIDYWQDAPLWDKGKINKATKVWFKYFK